MHGATSQDIAYGNFADGASPLAKAEKSKSESGGSATPKSCSSPPECAILSLELTSTHANDTVKKSASYNAPHGAPDPGAGRFRVIPLNSVKIEWKLENSTHIDCAVIELFPFGGDKPVWSLDLDSVAGDAGEHPWDTKVSGGQVAFPDDVVNMEHSPYKLKMTIRPKEKAVCAHAFAFTYFDVNFEHKYKATRYIPTTDLGRIGLEFDETEAEIKLLARTFFVMQVPERASFSRTLEYYKTEFRNTCSAMWNQRYALRDANDKKWKVSLIVEDAGSASVNGADDARTIDACPPDVIAAFDASGADFCVVLLPGNGGSGLPTPDFSRAANIFLYEVAFDAIHPPATKNRVLEGHRDLMVRDWDAAWPKYATHTAVKEARTPQTDPKFLIKFDRDSDDLNADTKSLLQELSASLKSNGEGMDFRVFVKGCRTAVEAPRLEELRATRVNELLAPDPHPCRRTAIELADAPPETSVSATDNAQVEGAYVVVKSLGADIPYSASVHEFGHLLGLPDEYAAYGPTFCDKVAPSQAEYLRLSRAEHFEHCPIPYVTNNDLMSAGTLFWQRYYLTVLQTQRKLLGLYDEREDGQWTVVDCPTPAAPPAAVPFTDYAPLLSAVKTGENLIDGGEDTLAALETAMKTKAESLGVQRVVYSKILDRSGLGRKSAGGPKWTVGDHLLLAIGVQSGRKLLHCMSYVKPKLVKPVIEIPGAASSTTAASVVHLRRLDVTRREKITLRSTQTFQGSGTFTCASPGIEFYTTESGGAPVAGIDTGLHLTSVQLAQGYTLYADNELDGAKLNLVLAPTAGQVSTVPLVRDLKYAKQDEPWMQIYNFSVDPAEINQPLRAIERTNGAFVPLSGTDNPEHLRQRVMLKVCLPLNYDGNQKMILRVQDDFLSIFKRRGDPANKAKGSKKSRTVDDRQITWREYELRPKGQKDEHFPDGRTMSVWLEGKALTDEAQVQLVSTTFRQNRPAQIYDEFKARVGVCHEATLEIPATDPLTVRNVPAGGPANNATPQVFCARKVAAIVGGDSPYARRDFTRNPPMVVVKGSFGGGKTLKLKARYSVGLKTQFFCEQAADDHATLKAANTRDGKMPLAKTNQSVPYTIGNMAPTDIEVEVPTDHAGSFHILMKVGDCTCYVVNLVVVEALALAGPEVPTVANLPLHKTNVHTRGFVGGLAMEVRTGNIPFPSPQNTTIPNLQAACCTVLSGRVHIRGGGPDFKRGVENRVFAGWIQNKTQGQIAGSYRDASGMAPADYTMEARFVRNQSDGFLLAATGDRFFGNDQPALDIIPFGPANPFLDTGNAQAGGSQTCLGQRKFAWDPVTPGDCTAVAVDSPGTEFLVSHFTKKNALLRRAVYQHTFKSYLCVWTDATGRDLGPLAPPDNPGPGDLLYAVVADVEWGFDAAWDVAWPVDIASLTRDGRQGVPDWHTRATITPDIAKPFTAQITSPYRIYPAAVPAQGLVETRPPMPIRTLAWDAKAP